MKTKITSILLSLLATASFGSGFVCTQDDGDIRVKLFNHVHPELGTRTPAVLVISDENGMVLTRKGKQIQKKNRLNTVQYIVDGGEAGDAYPLEGAILQVRFKEGQETIEAGDTVPAQLILMGDGDKDVSQLSCERYLTE